MIVVDTNIIVYFWIKGEFTSLAEKLLRLDPDWHVPLLWRSEFRNILAGLIRRGTISIETAIEILDNAESQFHNKEYLVSSREVMNLVIKSNCSAYDCEFVALSKKLNAPLVTADKQIINNFPDTAFAIERYIIEMG